MGQTIVIGPPDDANGGYSRLQLGAGEPHVPRTDLSRTITPVSFAFTSFAQMTDLHIVDDQSPLRVEWLDRYGNQGPPHEESYPFRAAYRPHECLSTQVADAMCRNISMIGRGPRTGLPLAFTMVSGDGVDNCQFNEARWYVDVLDGQPITPNSGGSFDHSVTGDSLGLDINYWHPANRDFELSNTKGPGLDLYFQGGFPEAKQLPGAARQPFTAHGLRMPWFAAYGNHDTFVQGNVPIDGSFYGIDIGGALGLDLKSIATGPSSGPTSPSRCRPATRATCSTTRPSASWWSSRTSPGCWFRPTPPGNCSARVSSSPSCSTPTAFRLATASTRKARSPTTRWRTPRATCSATSSSTPTTPLAAHAAGWTLGRRTGWSSSCGPTARASSPTIARQRWSSSPTSRTRCS